MNAFWNAFLEMSWPNKRLGLGGVFFYPVVNNLLWTYMYVCEEGAARGKLVFTYGAVNSFLTLLPKILTMKTQVKVFFVLHCPD